MKTQSYSNGPEGKRMDACAIVYGIIMFGCSEGWQGSIEDRDAVKEILAPFNVIYTDDMRGRWELKGGEDACQG